MALLVLSCASVLAVWRLASTRHSGPESKPHATAAQPQATPSATDAAAALPASAPEPTAPAPASTIAHSVSGHDRFAAATPLEVRWLATDAANANEAQRWRLVPTGDALVPVARVVDHLTRETPGADWRLRLQEVMRPDAVMIEIPSQQTAAHVAAELQSAGYATAPHHPHDAVIVVQLAAIGLDGVHAALARLRADFPQLNAAPDFLRFAAQATPNDFDPSTLWGLENIEAPAAWSVITGSSSVVVAVLDSGMNATHPDLAPNLWTNPGEIAGNSVDDDGNGFVDDVHGWDFAANSAAIIDNDGHGTHVSGTIGAAGNNGQGVTGVNWSVRIIPLRCGDATFPDSQLINAVRYLTALRNRTTNPVNIVAINASLGGSTFNSIFRQEIATAGAAGMLLVAAAGNDGTNNDTSPTYPASYDLDTIISVASCHLGGGRSKFSSYGVTSVDLAAPGSAIYSTTRDGSYGFQNGTSMAAPHVTGAVALVAVASPETTAAQRRARILENVDAVSALAGVVATGGKLNLRRAVAPTLLRPRVAITSPDVEVIAMDRAGLSVALTASLLPDHGSMAVATLAWDAPEGPAAVNFSSTAGATTTATFPSAGRYRVRVRATAGALQESDSVVVAVGSVQPDDTGLRAHWNFDEASGAALDSSGDARTGTLNGATRTGGVLGSALQFNGTTDNVNFAAPSLTRVTISGWARATGAGNSNFPRVVHMRPGLLFFGLDGGSTSDDANNGTLKFALDDGTATPVWHTAPGSLSLNQWFHVGVSYDPSATAPAPKFYINGVPQPLGTQASGAATPPTVAAGQGYIGDRGDALREWLGQLDEIRIYERELGVSEMALLGHGVTVHALVNGTLTRNAHSNPFTVPLVFAPATTGLAAPILSQTSWSATGGSASFAPTAGTATTMTVASPGDYLVRFDGTSEDGVHVVRTLEVTVVVDPVTTPGYYSGTTSAGGIFTLIVDDNGVGTFFGSGQRGYFRQGFSVATWGGFSFTDASGASLTGLIDASGGVSGSIGNSATFSGSRRTTGFGAADPSRDGNYAGWVLDSGVRATGHVERGRVVVVTQESGAQRAAEGAVDAGGTFALSPASGVSFSGAIGGEKLSADIDLPGSAARRLVLFRSGYNPARRLLNLSLRGLVGTGDAALIPGFALEGPDALPMLVRGIGPGLEQFGVSGFLAQPRLLLHQGPTMILENIRWSTAANVTDITAAAIRVNAFPLDASKADSAVFGALAAVTYTVLVTGNDGGSGVALAEAYDARLGGENARLINLSGRGHVETGDNILIGGFVIGGDAPALVLVRGIGPTLANFGLRGALQQPVLTIFRQQPLTSLVTGTAWGLSESANDITAAAALTSAFRLSDDSADAALLLFLEPGSYTAQVSGANATTGIALVEIYLVPDF